jgi:hypothetical protein
MHPGLHCPRAQPQLTEATSSLRLLQLQLRHGRCQVS